MNAKTQKRLAAKIAKRSSKKVKLNPARLAEIKEAITKVDIRSIFKQGLIETEKNKGISRVRAKKRALQKVKGRRKGHGTRKGSSNARFPSKEAWMNRIRLQRELLLELKKKKKISQEVYKDLYLKAKGGFFRSKRHLKLFMTEHKLIK